MELSDQMKSLLKDLGMALHQAVTKDPNIRQITDEIKAQGYDIYLVMEANIALDKRDGQQEGSLYYHSPEDQIEIEAVPFNPYDRQFLSELKIKLDDDF